ncbi:MAG: ADP-ribosylation factor-like protein, partial [Promethearchaeota archaeon]
MSTPKLFKIITAGDGGVGKTTLLYRYVEGRFLESTKMTLGVEFFMKEIHIEDEIINLQVWDFGGQE